MRATCSTGPDTASVAPELEVEDPFVVHGRVGGHFARILIDCGCNTLMMNYSFAKRAKLPTRELGTDTAIDWGNSNGTSVSNQVVNTYLELWGDEGVHHKSEDTRTFLLAPLRVDVILGLPMLHWLKQATIKQIDGRPGLTFTNSSGQEIRIRARATHRHWEPPTCVAARLRANQGEVDSPRFQPASRPIPNCITPKEYRAFQKRELIAQAFAVCVRTMNASATANQEEDLFGSMPEDHPLRRMLEGYKDTLFKEATELPPDRGDDNFRIELLPDAQPVFLPLRHMPQDELDELHRQVQTLLDKGWIRHSESPWGAPVLFAKKKDGGLRCCIDYRRLNSQTKKDRTPLPNLAELRDRLHGKKYFTSVDIKDAYHRLLIRPEDREKTAFRTRFGHFEYLVMPFGLSNAPATFQRLTNKILCNG